MGVDLWRLRPGPDLRAHGPECTLARSPGPGGEDLPLLRLRGAGGAGLDPRRRMGADGPGEHRTRRLPHHRHHAAGISRGAAGGFLRRGGLPRALRPGAHRPAGSQRRQVDHRGHDRLRRLGEYPPAPRPTLRRTRPGPQAGLHDRSQVASAMRSLHIAMIVCDLAPDTRPVQKLMQDFPGRVLMADYSLLRVQGQAWFEKRDGGRVAINRTLGLDATREPLVMGADGGDVFPDCEARRETEVRAQLAASVRTLQKNQHGQPVANWVETGPDHMRHAHLYYRVAAMQGGSVGHLVPIVKQRPDPNRMY